MRIVLAIVLISQAATGAALAQNRGGAPCSEPIEPTCVASDITYEDEQRIERCRQDVVRFEKQLSEYIACLQDKVAFQRSRKEEIRETFECRVAGKSDC